MSSSAVEDSSHSLGAVPKNGKANGWMTKDSGVNASCEEAPPQCNGDPPVTSQLKSPSSPLVAAADPSQTTNGGGDDCPAVAAPVPPSPANGVSSSSSVDTVTSLMGSVKLKPEASSSSSPDPGEAGHSSSPPPSSVAAPTAAKASDNQPDSVVVVGAAVSPSVTQDIEYVVYDSELQMPDIMRLIQKDLSEPYSIYTYRYFIHNWPHLCFMAHVRDEYVGAIVCKLDYHKKIVKRGYIAMLAVDSRFRKKKIGSTLVRKAIDAMIEQEADEVVLETEITNKPALRLYENLGFVRDKRLFRYYLNGVDALRLKLWLK